MQTAFSSATPRPLRLLVGVSGGIAAYKAAELVRQFVTRGAEVQVVMTAGAREFITPLTFQALSGRPVRDSLWDGAAEAAMGHIELARWPDAIVVAPATADLLARMAQGHADDLLTTLLLATDRPIHVAPAMNRLMWANAATQDNVALLRSRGIVVHGPAEGAQACGETGPGRMVEPEALAAAVWATLPTTNADAPRPWPAARSSLRLAPRASPSTRYVSSPTALAARWGMPLPQQRAMLAPRSFSCPGRSAFRRPLGYAASKWKARRRCTTPCTASFTARMYSLRQRPWRTIAPLLCAGKDQESAETMELQLRRAPDILASVAALAVADRPFTVGFAAETCDVERHARDKLVRKNLDLIAANQVGGGKGFDRDENELLVLWADGGERLALQDKRQLLTNSLPSSIVACRWCHELASAESSCARLPPR